MPRADEKHRFTYINPWVQEYIVILACFFYLLLRIHPVLILEAHPPVFLKGTDFLGDFLKIPGGLVNWLSALLMQFWLSDFLSALFLTICFWIVGFLTRKWIETLTENRPIHTIHLIPVGLLLVLYSNYDFDLSATLAIIINLFFLVLFIRWSPKQPVIRIGLGLAITVLLYWITGGAFLMFAVLCGLEDLLFKKKIVSGILLLLISALLPFVASMSVFLITLRQAYLHNLTFENPIESWIIVYSLPVFFLLTLIIASSAKVPGIRKPFRKFARLAYVWKLAAGTFLLVSGTILLAKESTSDIKKLVLQVNQAVREERWTDVLESTRHYPSMNPLLLYQTNFALFQTGKLLDRMFAYPQTLGTVGLLMDYEWCTSWPEEASNVFWKLGLLSESQHWAHEAFEYKGHTPHLLKRLGMVYMLKGNNEAASRYFINLRNVPFENTVAENLIRINTNPSEIGQDSVLSHVQACMLTEDVVYSGGPSSFQLELLLKRNPKNKMAFEYLMAYYLLDGNLKEIYTNVSKFAMFDYSQLPRHIQEALIFGAAVNQKLEFNLVKNMIDPFIFKRFMEYRQIILNHRGNNGIARQYLQGSFSDTYWYYFMFNKPAPQKLKSQQ